MASTLLPSPVTLHLPTRLLTPQRLRTPTVHPRLLCRRQFSACLLSAGLLYAPLTMQSRSRLRRMALALPQRRLPARRCRCPTRLPRLRLRLRRRMHRLKL